MAAAAKAYDNPDDSDASTTNYCNRPDGGDDGVKAVMQFAAMSARSPSNKPFQRAPTPRFLVEGASKLIGFKIGPNASPGGKHALGSFQNKYTVQPADGKKLMDLIKQAPAKSPGPKIENKPSDQQIADRMGKALEQRRKAANNHGLADTRRKAPIGDGSEEQMGSFAAQIDIIRPGLPDDAKEELMATRVARAPLQAEHQAILQSTLRTSNIDISSIAGGRDGDAINKLVRNRTVCAPLPAAGSRWGKYGAPRSGGA